jgi:hypothetical protein
MVRVNGFSKSTGRRIKQSGNGPNFTQLSPNRVGVTVGENRRWLASRKIG